MTPSEFHSALIAYCSKLDGSITSYGRTTKRNNTVGGVTFSKHLIWLAADVVYDESIDPEIRLKTADQLGLLCIVESDHDHLQAR